MKGIPSWIGLSKTSACAYLSNKKARSLKVDVKRIPEWQQNIRDIEDSCTNVDRARLARNLSELSKNGSISTGIETAEVILSGNLPNGLEALHELPDIDKLTENIQSKIDSKTVELQMPQKKGLTGSTLLAIFTPFTHKEDFAVLAQDLQSIKKRHSTLVWRVEQTGG